MTRSAEIHRDQYTNRSSLKLLVDVKVRARIPNRRVTHGPLKQDVRRNKFTNTNYSQINNNKKYRIVRQILPF